jgi:hypothetical protein
MTKITYMCAECAQDFTRKPSATRHNTNLHYGRGRIVPFIDYIIGRITGEYLPSNPYLFRSAKKRPQKPFCFNKDNNNNPVRLTAPVADAKGDEFRCGNSARPVIESIKDNPDHHPFDPLSQMKRKENDMKHDSVETLLEVSPKLAEVKLLLSPHVIPELIQWIVKGWNAHILASGKTNGFSDYVDWLEKFVKLKEAIS